MHIRSFIRNAEGEGQGGGTGEGETGTGEGKTEGKTEGEGSGAKKPWFQHRIDELTGKWRTSEEEKQELQRERDLLSEALKAKPKDGDDSKAPDPALTEAEIDRRAAEKAKKLAAEGTAQAAYTAQCNAIAAEGRKAHEDFDVAISMFNRLGGLDAPTVLAAAETEAPHEVLYFLGKNLDKAAEIMNLPPLKRAIACERLARDLKESKGKAPKLTKAPAPAEPLEGSRGTIEETDLRKVDMAKFVAMREKQVAERRGRVH